MHCASPLPVSRGPQFRVQRPCRAICGISCPVTQVSAPSPPDRALRRRCRFTGTQPSLVCRGSHRNLAGNPRRQLRTEADFYQFLLEILDQIRIKSDGVVVCIGACQGLRLAVIRLVFLKGCYRHTHDRAVIAVLIVLTLDPRHSDHDLLASGSRGPGLG